MCEMSYEHRGVEYSDGRANTAAMESLKWAIKKEIRELKLKGDGINLLYCACRCEHHKDHEIEIQEKRDKFSFIMDNRNLYTADSLTDCVKWAKAAGHLDKDEKIGENRTSATKPATAATRKATPAATKATPTTTAADKLAKWLSWKSPSSGHPGWR